MNEAELQLEIDKFINEYFSKMKDISDFHLNFFKSNNIETININMITLKEIIFRALNFLQDIDEKFVSKLIKKLYIDIKALLKFLNNFEKNNKLVNHIFEHQFLHKFKPYLDLEDKISINKTRANTQRTLMLALENELKFLKPKTKAEISEYNRLRGKHVDAIHNYSKAKDDIIKYTKELKELKESIRYLFNSQFENRKKLETDKLKLVINTKLYYLNKLMWLEASKSYPIINYFNNMGIKNININIYARNYLKQINKLNSSKNIEKFEEIEEALKELEE